MKKNQKKNYHVREDTIGRTKLFFILVSLVILFDRVTKYLAFKYLASAKDAIPGVLSFRFEVNTGAAFSIFAGKTLLLSIISIISIAVILFYTKSIMPKRYYWTVALILGGAISNLFDRVFYGFVIDFISIDFFSVFNLADTAISVGAAALFIYLLKETIANKEAG